MKSETKDDLDILKIDKVVNLFFDAFTNKSKKPNLESLHQLCLQKAIIINNTNGLCETYDLNEFIISRKEILSNGTLNNFVEHEQSKQTEVVGHIAHRISNYKKVWVSEGHQYTGIGVKMFQFARQNNDWKICAIIWDDH
ncbi:MAG: hypothetical protein AB8B74_07625 [Crocinitomicaceae bacterium]